MKPFWEMKEEDIKNCLEATDWCRADYEYFRGGGYSSHFRCHAEMIPGFSFGFGKKCINDPMYFNKLKNQELLFIDDIGTEPASVKVGVTSSHQW